MQCQFKNKSKTKRDPKQVIYYYLCFFFYMNLYLYIRNYIIKSMLPIYIFINYDIMCVNKKIYFYRLDNIVH